MITYLFRVLRGKVDWATSIKDKVAGSIEDDIGEPVEVVVVEDDSVPWELGYLIPEGEESEF